VPIILKFFRAIRLVRDASGLLLRDIGYVIRTFTRSETDRFSLRSESLHFSILLPVHRANVRFLRKAIGSVIRQSYSNWELCITDDGSMNPLITERLMEYGKSPRIKFASLESSEGIAVATNSSLAMATGDWMVFLDHDDLLTRDALGRIAAVIEGNPGLRLIYSDEDKISTWGWRFDPYFKPDWSPDLLLNQNYLCHLVAVRADLVRELGGISEGFDGAQDWDFVLRATERCSAEQIHHIPRVLYHWRAVRGSTARSRDSKPAVPAASMHALREACTRRGVAFSEVEMMERGGHFRIRRSLPSPPPLVSVIIPTRNKPELLKKCLLGLREKTDYPALEILVVDNGSDDPAIEEIYSREGKKIRLLRDPGPFNFSAMNNHTAREANGEILLLLNNDVEPLDPEWLREMVTHAVRPEIGAVGAMLLYPNGRIQHAGITLGIAGPMRVGGVAGHPGKRMRPDTRVMGNLLNVTRNVSAVTGACLAIRKELYQLVGGMDDGLPVAFNDVDFCIRVMKAGYRNLWTPHARLIHHESLSRGREDSPQKIDRFRREVRIMRERWGDLLDKDPYYNPNLTLVHENWGLGEAPRYNRS
jgi:GT2 family glycosyltransferase